MYSKKRQFIKSAAIAACFAVLTAAPALADTVTNLVPSLPGFHGWGYSGSVSSQGTTSILLPNNTTGNAWQFTSASQSGGADYSHISITSGQPYTSSAYVQYVSHGTGGSQYGQALVSDSVFGRTDGAFTGINFNTQTCAFISNQNSYPGTYEISQVLSQEGSKWCRVGLTFKATASTTNAAIAFAAEYTATTLDVWGVDFINLPYWAQHIETASPPTSATNQYWSAPDGNPCGIGTSAAGRAGLSTGGWATIYLCNIGNGSMSLPESGNLYSYFYVKKTSVSNPDGAGFPYSYSGSYGEFDGDAITVNTNTGAITHLLYGGLAGVIDAGDSWLIWVNIGSTTGSSTSLNVTEGDVSGSTGIVMLRSGLQADGIFP